MMGDMLKKIIAVVFILILIGMTGLWIFASREFKPLLESKIGEALDRKVSIEKASLRLPFKVELDGVVITEKRFGIEKDFVAAF